MASAYSFFEKYTTDKEGLSEDGDKLITISLLLVILSVHTVDFSNGKKQAGKTRKYYYQNYDLKSQ